MTQNKWQMDFPNVVNLIVSNRYENVGVNIVGIYSLITNCPSLQSVILETIDIKLTKFDADTRVLHINFLSIDTSTNLERLLEAFTNKSITSDSLKIYELSITKKVVMTNLWQNFDRFFPHVSIIEIHNRFWDNDSQPTFTELHHLIYIKLIGIRTDLEPKSHVLEYFAKCATNVRYLDLDFLSFSGSSLNDFKRLKGLSITHCKVTGDVSEWKNISPTLELLIYEKSPQEEAIKVQLADRSIQYGRSSNDLLKAMNTLEIR